MGKKTQERIILIKFLLEKGRSQAQITRETGIPQQTVSRLVKKINNNNDDNKEKKIRSKLPQKYIDKIYKLASNKSTSEMGGEKIANIINNSLERDKITNKNGEIKSISRSQVNKILKRKYKRIYKKRKVFILTKEHKEKRFLFCKKIIENKLKGKDIFFTDETLINTEPYTDSIMLSKKKTN